MLLQVFAMLSALTFRHLLARPRFGPRSFIVAGINCGLQTVEYRDRLEIKAHQVKYSLELCCQLANFLVGRERA